MKQTLKKLAHLIDGAAHHANAVSQLSLTNDFNLDDAYVIQKLSIEERLKRGEKRVGYKLGFTSKAKMEQMGVHDVIWGQLTDSMHIENGGVLDFSKFIHPRAEPEIAFRVSKKIDTALTMDNVGEYFDGVAGAIEIIDSRYEKFKFSLEDVVADNCSSSAYVVGKWFDPKTSINDLSITLNINDETRKEGNSNAILGNPIESLLEMSKMSLKYGEAIEVGSLILAGAATSAEYLKSGDVIQAVFKTLGSVNLTVG